MAPHRASGGGEEFVASAITGGAGFILADGLDRLLATYDPAAAEKPKDKFTSDGAGTLANSLNVASKPGLGRLATGVGMVAAPAVGSAYVDNPYGKAALQGAAIGAGINLFKTLWNSFVMPMLIGKDTSTAALQKSYIARLYPAEVAAAINTRDHTTAISSTSSGALSGVPRLGMGADPGPFAVGGDSPYDDAEQALRRAAGLSGDSPYPDAEQALRRAAGVSGDSPYDDAAQALRRMGVSDGWQPGPPSDFGPGPQASPDAACGCIGDEANPYLGFIGDRQDDRVQFWDARLLHGLN